mgnify:CR=1 FL=1
MTVYGGNDMGEKEISEKMQDIMKRMKTRREELNMSYQTLSEKVNSSKIRNWLYKKYASR